jgi:hypothetical protein
MMYKFTKSLLCSPARNRPDLPQDDPDGTTCANTIMNKFEKKFGIKLHAETRHEKVNGHVSVKHNNGKHIIWLFIYSESGIFESIRGDKIIKQKSNRVIKFSGTFPTESEVKKAI